MNEPKIHPPPPLSTPRLAPWEHVELLCEKLDRLISLMQAGAPPPEWPGWEPVISKLNEIKVQLGELEIKVTTPWVAKEPEEIFRLAIRTAGTFSSDKMLNWTEGKRLLLRVDSSLDQVVQIQAIGNIGNTVDKAVDISVPNPCAAGSRISIGFAWDDWQPYIGAEIIVALAPTAGELTITAVIQE